MPLRGAPLHRARRAAAAGAPWASARWRGGGSRGAGGAARTRAGRAMRRGCDGWCLGARRDVHCPGASGAHGAEPRRARGRMSAPRAAARLRAGPSASCCARCSRRALRSSRREKACTVARRDASRCSHWAARACGRGRGRLGREQARRQRAEATCVRGCWGLASRRAR